MITYKITNVTNLASKRDHKYNSTLDIDYIDGMVRKTVKVKPGNSLYLTVPALPLSVHRLRVKNLITVTEANITKLENVAVTPKPEVKEEKKKSAVAEIKNSLTKKTSKKKTYPKKEEKEEKTIEEIKED